MFEINLEGKSALVTGGSRGIGKAAARLLAEAGCHVAVGYQRDREAAEEVVAGLLRIGRRALAIGADAGSHAGCRRLIDEAVAALGAIDVLVVNAGIWKRAPIERITPEQIEETLAVNLKSAFYLCQSAVGVMRKSGAGNIILVSSTAGQRGEAFYSHYAASKAALIGLTKSLAAELGPLGIRVNCVAPGWVLTDMTREVFDNEAFRSEVREDVPLRRIAEPEDVAGPILFLASDLSRHVHGEVLNVNGGSVLCG